MCVEGQIHLLDELQNLLEKQITLAQQGDIGEVEVLIERTGSLIEKISGTGIPESDEFENRKERLQKLYSSLSLALAVRNADVAEKLEQIQKGRKIIRTYRRNI
jgi:hypothetical protein